MDNTSRLFCEFISSERLRTYKHAIVLAVRFDLAMKQCCSNHTVYELLHLGNQAWFILRFYGVLNAIQAIDNEMIRFIIFCLNCIRHGRNETYELGVSFFRGLFTVL